jgi:hypothetical protein
MIVKTHAAWDQKPRIPGLKTLGDAARKKTQRAQKAPGRKFPKNLFRL